MAARLSRAIVVEGKDDVAAVRALLRADLGLEARSQDPDRSKGAPITFEYQDLVVDVYAAATKSGLATSAVDAARGTGRRPDRVFVCFDPDRDGAGRELDFFARAFEREVEKRRAGPLTRRDGRLLSQIQREIEIVSAPWRSEAEPTFDDAPHAERCLERVLIGGVLQSPGASVHRAWAEQAAGDLAKVVGELRTP